MKTKEQLSDEKLFADFIEVKIYEDLDWDNNQFGWKYDISGIKIMYDIIFDTFNPLEDWNLLHKAYSKIYKIKINSKTHKKIYVTYLSIWQGILDGLFESNKEEIYKHILQFIKFYDQINTNTNNNQS